MAPGERGSDSQLRNPTEPCGTPQHDSALLFAQTLWDPSRQTLRVPAILAREEPPQRGTSCAEKRKFALPAACFQGCSAGPVGGADAEWLALLSRGRVAGWGPLPGGWSLPSRAETPAAPPSVEQHPRPISAPVG